MSIVHQTQLETMHVHSAWNMHKKFKPPPPCTHCIADFRAKNLSSLKRSNNLLSWGRHQPPILMLHSVAWDGATGGRIQAIVRHSTSRNKGHIMRCFQHFDPLLGILGEIHGHESGTDACKSTRRQP